MKRIKIWLNSFSLVQQFIAVGFLTVFIFITFFFTFLNNNINNFVTAQMKSYLHRYEEHYLASENMVNFYSDSNVESFVYSKRTNMYLNRISPRYQRVILNINPIVEITTDGIINIDDTDYIYSVTNFNNPDFSLVSFISNDYIREFKIALTQGVVNIAVFVIFGLFVFFLIWVGSLIHPLHSIRNYIDKIKSGEKAELVVNRNDEIGEVAEALISMNDELSKQQRIREEMVQNISHDLKTPIATIKSYSESIKDGVYPYDTLEKSVDVIIDHANRLEKKAYNLNTFNKLGYLVDSNSETNMAQIIEKTILSIEAIRNEIKIETNIDNSVYFHGEEEPWRIVVENLLDNSLRYAKSIVRINLEDRLLEVFNDGEQMPKDRLDKLFKPYEKGTKGNFGLGLSIVKRVCDTYGYTVLGENMDDGVIFRVYTNRASHRPNKKQKSK